MGQSNKKQLTSSTMGMIFMQRKQEGKKKTKDVFHPPVIAAGKNNRNHATTNNDASMDVNATEITDRKRDNDEISTAPSASSNNNNNNSDDEAIILELATAVDAYGTGSDIIGRRSFGGFHKSVRTTWDAALKQRTDDAAGGKIRRRMLRTRNC